MREGQGRSRRRKGREGVGGTGKGWKGVEGRGREAGEG